MASTKISALPGASTLTGAETIPLVQGGTTKKVTTDQFLIKDASGNVGLGVTPSAWVSGARAVDIGQYCGIWQDASGYPGMGFNAYQAVGTGWTYKTTGNPATRTSQTSGAFQWYTAPSGTAGNAISFTQAMTLDSAGLKIGTSGYEIDPVGARFGYYTGGALPTTYLQAPAGGGGIEFWNSSTSVAAKIDASGNLGIGNTTPVSKLDVLASGGVNSLHFGATANTDSGGYLNSSGSTEALLSGGANYNSYSAPNFVMTAKGPVGVASGVRFSNGEVNFWTNTGLTAGTTFNQSVKAIIDASGNLLVGATSGNTHTLQKSGSNEYAVKIVNTTATNSYGVLINLSGVTGGAGQYFLQGIDDATRFQILGNGNIQNLNNSYGAISDLKLKENVTDASPKLAKLMQVRIVNYNLKADPDKTKLIGVVAQELEKVSPGLIEETKDYEEVKKTREVTKSVPVTEQVTVQREQKTVEVVDGKAVVTVTLVDEQTAVPVVDKYPLFDADGQPVLEVDTPEVPEVLDEDGNVTQPAVPATYRQAMHSVPRMQDVTETEEYTERVPLGTNTKSVKYSVFVPMLVKAVQEQQTQIESLAARLAALEAKRWTR